jgi:hypothetical protein
MRWLFALALCVPALVSAVSASAEVRTFVLDIDTDGYGIDRCLAGSASCGSAAASAYCRARDFAQVRSFRKIGADDVTAATGTARRGNHVAIECVRLDD